MSIRQHRGRSRPLFAFVSGGAALAVILSGCSTTDDEGGSAGSASSVLWGASAAEYAAALADMDPVTLVWDAGEVAPAAANYSQSLEVVEFITEASGGKITIETNVSGSVVAIPENLRALVDGRLDIASVFPQYDPSEHPVANMFVTATTMRDPRFITGLYSNAGTVLDVAWNTPELLEEWENHGVEPILLIDGQGTSMMNCTSPVNTLADLRGKQVRSGGTVQARELESLGMIPVSMPYTELYEALQRGIIDCGISVGGVVGPTLDVAPHLVVPGGASFTSVPSTLMGSAKFSALPPEAKQLIREAYLVWSSYYGKSLEHLRQVHFPLAAEAGGGLSVLASDVDDALEAVHAELITEMVEASHFDGAAVLERLEAAHEKWVALVVELGYVDEGPLSDFANWGDTTAFGPSPYVEAVYDEIYSRL